MSATNRQAGLSIVELMVSILIGLIILSGVLQVVLTSKQSFVAQDEMAFIQENARYAMDVLSRDIQSAGHFGCAGTNSRLVLSIQQASASKPLGPLIGREALMGFGPDATLPMIDLAQFGDETVTRPRLPRVTADNDTRSDVLVVRRAGGVGLSVNQHLGSRLNLNEPADTDIASVDLLEHVAKVGSADVAPVAVVAEDCQRVGVFRAAVVGDALETAGFACEGPLKPTITNDFLCNASCGDCVNAGAISTSQLYLQGATAYSYLNYAYYIGRRQSDNEPALMRAVLHGDGNLDRQEIAIGVEEFKVQYGVDSNLNGQLSYLDAGGVAGLIAGGTGDAWQRVRAVRLELTFRSQAPSANAPDDKFPDDVYEGRYVRQKLVNTVRLRNKT